MADNVIVRVGEKEWVRGEDGYSPEVTIEDIAHGHRVTITDKEHPEGQSVDLLDGYSAYEQAAAGGYEGTEAEFNEELAAFDQKVKDTEKARDDAESYADGAINANQWAQSARDDAYYFSGQAEKWAVGKNAGQDVPSSDPTYHNNAKYYAQEAGNAVAAVNAAKADALQAVENKSTTEQAAVEQKGEAVLASIPEDYTDLSGDVADLKGALSSDMFAERYVKYNSLTPYSMGSNANRPDFTRYGNRFTFNGSFGSDSAYYIKLSEAGSTNYSSSRKTASEWDKQVQFLAGHTYRAKLTLINGSYTLATGGYINVTLYKSDGTTIYFGFDEVIFTPGAVTSNVVFIATGGTVLTNAEFTFTIEDITESSLDTSAKTVKGAINELVGEINGLDGLIAKCLTSDYTQATVIPAESDFDDYTTDGNYRVGSDATAAQGTGIKNMPVQKAGRLFVMHPYKSTRLVQIWIMAQAEAIWVRRYTTSWSTWDELLGSHEIVDSVTNGLWNPISSGGVYNAIAKTPKNTMGLAYSWWVNNRVMDSYGNLYFGYISDDKNGMKCGVGCRYPDGSVNRRDIFSSNEDDDHNAPSVILITKDNKEYVCVIGSTGHNTDSKINCYIATESNSITCAFTNVTHTMTQPEGYTLKNSYSQAYYDNDNSKIYNFFRVKQRPVNAVSDLDFYMVWLCAIGSVADDLSVTWTIYRVFALNSPQGASEPVQKGTLFYMWSQNVDNNDYMKRIVIQCNTTYGSGDSLRSIRTGIVDCKNLKIYSAYADTTHDPVSDYLCDMSVVADGELPYDPEDTSTAIALYDDFTEVVPVDPTDNYRYRILDVFRSRKVELSILYAKSATNPSGTNGHKQIRDWILYKRAKSDFSSQSVQWVTTEIAHLGRQFFDSSSYVTGANFINNSKNKVVYSKNDVSTEDGEHSLHYAQIANDVVTTDRIIKRSAHTLARPAQFDDGSIMFLVGNYNIGDGISEEGYMKWHFGIQFMDGIEENTVNVGT